MEKTFAPYRLRLFFEAGLKSLIGGISLGAVCEFLFLVVMHLLSSEPAAYMLLLVAAVPFLIASALLFSLRYYPSLKRTAARIDGTGLDERVGTMLELQGNKTYIAGLQRGDAMSHLHGVKPKDIRFSFAKKRIVFCAVFTVLAVSLLFVPYTVMDIFAADANADEAEAELIKSLLAGLREKVDEAQVGDGLKEQLNDIIDELEDKLNEESGTLDKAAEISDAEAGIKKLLEDSVTKIRIGSALKQFDSTYELGKAISAGDTEAVTAALDAMLSSFTGVSGGEQADLLGKVASDIQNALGLADVEAGDPLRDALDTYSLSLSEAAEGASAGENVDNEVESAVSTANDAIIAALEEQARTEEAAKEFNDLLEDAKDGLFGNETGEASDKETGEAPDGETGEAPDGEKSDGEKPDGESGEMPDGEMPDGEKPDGEMSGGGSGEGEGGGSDMTEQIYDSYSGSVEYGELFAAYYAEYLNALEAGKVPDELQEIIDQYFNSLIK